MEIRTNVAGDVVYVQVTKSIQVGNRYRVSPSQGYAGVIEGVVEVTHILSSSDLQDVAGDDDTADLVAMVEGYKDAELSMLTDRDDLPLEPEYSDHLQYLDNTVWIAYRYPYGEGINEGLLVFPIEEFLQHTSLF